MLGQNIVVVRACNRGELLTSWQTGSKEQNRKELGQDTPKDPPQVTYFLHFPKFPNPPKIVPQAFWDNTSY
jgi:hypothetical protein